MTAALYRPPPCRRPQTAGQSIYEAYGPATTLSNDSWAVDHTGGNASNSTLVERYPPTNWIAVKLTNYAPPDSKASTTRSRQSSPSSRKSRVHQGLPRRVRYSFIAPSMTS